jgi:hypothetical protein
MIAAKIGNVFEFLVVLVFWMGCVANAKVNGHSLQTSARVVF